MYWFNSSVGPLLMHITHASFVFLLVVLLWCIATGHWCAFFLVFTFHFVFVENSRLHLACFLYSTYCTFSLNHAEFSWIMSAMQFCDVKHTACGIPLFFKCSNTKLARDFNINRHDYILSISKTLNISLFHMHTSTHTKTPHSLNQIQSPKRQSW